MINKLDFFIAVGLCPTCGKSEDNKHIILECPDFKDIRDKYFPRNFSWESLTKNALLQSKMVTGLILIGKMLYEKRFGSAVRR